MGGKNKQRTKNNVRPSSSGRSAEILNNAVMLDSTMLSVGGGKIVPNLFPTLATVTMDPTLNPELAMCIKKLNKKDPITKYKALQELTELVNKSSVEEVEAALPSWSHFYKVLSIDVDCKVREGTQACHGAIVRVCGRRVAPQLRRLLPAWLQAQHDEHAPAQTLAQSSLKSTFPENKLPEVLAFCKTEIMESISEGLLGAAGGAAPADAPRTRAAALRALAWVGRRAPLALHGWLLAALEPLLAADGTWRAAGDADVGVRAAWYMAMGSLVERFKAALGGRCGARLVRLVLAGGEEPDPRVAAHKWACLLLIMHHVQAWHEWLDKKDLLAKRIIGVLENGGWGEAHLLAAMLLPLLANLPPETLTKDFYHKFFNSIFKGLEKKNVLNSKSERQCWITGLSECLRYLSTQRHEFVGEVVTAVHRTWLGTVLAGRHAGPLANHLAKHSASCMAPLLRYWLKQALEHGHSSYDQLVRNFWQNISSTMLAHVERPDTAEDELIRLADCHTVFLQTLKRTFYQEPKKQHRIKFADDVKVESLTKSEVPETAPEAAARRLSLEGEPAQVVSDISAEAAPSVPSGGVSAAVSRHFEHSVAAAAASLCDAYLSLACGQRSAGLLRAAAALLGELCAAAALPGGPRAVYCRLLHPWLADSAAREESVLDVVFLLLPHMTDDEQEETYASFNEPPVSVWWCTRALSHPHVGSRAARRWLLGPQAAAALRTAAAQHCAAPCDSTRELLLRALEPQHTGEMLVHHETVLSVVAQLSAALRPPAEHAERLVAVAARLVVALAPRPPHNYNSLLLALFKLTLVVRKSLENNDSYPEIIIEKQIDNQEGFVTNGNRIVDFAYIYEQFQNIANHNSAFGCNLMSIKMTKEIRKGFLSTFYFTCQMCNMKLEIKNSKVSVNPADLNLNDHAVSSFMSIGTGFSGMEQVAASLDIPSMSDKLYAKCHTKVCELWELAKEQSMADAAKEEYDMAVRNGDIDSHGVPTITVVADGCWSKRSYRKNFNALSGAAVIIGYRSKKVIYMAVKNKYCMVCARAENKKETIPEHVCFKNYEGSSSSMESAALVEGFKTSVQTHGLIYSRLIADGDSSTHRNIEKAKPYGNLIVEKIECTNHLLRNYCTKLDELTRNTSYPLKYRKAVESNLMRLRRAVTGAVKHINAQENKTFEQKVLELKEDLLNSPHHVFGNHSCCKHYYCKKTNVTAPQENFVPAMKSQEGGLIFSAIIKFLSRLVNNAKSLIYNVNSNIAEVFNSVIAKFIGGKRINYSGRQSYSGRCAASVVSFNTKHPCTYLSKKILLRSPNKMIKGLENKRNARRLAFAKRVIHRSQTIANSERRKTSTKQTDKNYGEFCQKSDLSKENYDFAVNEHMKCITLSDEDRHALERRTVLQAESIEWRQERKLRLTASVFGKVCKRRVIKCGPLVKALVMEKNLDHVKSIQHGQNHEHLARDQLEFYLKNPIKRCGLFIDKEFPFLGASPDGLVEDTKIVEIKCPYSARGKSIIDAIKEKKITFWNINQEGNVYLNKKHDWYFQAQGQIHITQRKICIFAVWTDVSMKIEIIEEDKAFWTMMENKLKMFYFDCLLPEIVDSRLDRQMEIREPGYILEAINERANKNKRKTENKKITNVKRKRICSD